MHFWRKEFKEQTLQSMIELGTIVAGREKILNKLHESNANRDVIAKGALLNFFTALPWFEKIMARHDKNYA